MSPEEQTMRKGIAVLLAATAVAAGCATPGKGTAIGAGVGAAVGAATGAVIGHQSDKRTEGALIGAGVGAVTGGIIGNQVDKRNAEQEADQQ
jgi:uncharacterized protein YcfJ